jgi:hypothetical protein
MAISDNAQTAALIETNFEDIKTADLSKGSVLIKKPPELKGYEILDVGQYSQGNFKAVTLRAPDGSIFVHFNGTGNGNWKYNAAAYGAKPQPSEMQDWSLKYFNDMIEKHHIGSSGSLYVTGHSQGGNNAQFVTISSKHGDRITQCISLDGPGFSHEFVEKSNKNGNYESQRDKIWAYNGENDYVSILGQESIVPDGHTLYIKYTGDGLDFMLFHDAKGLLENGEMSLVFGDTKFREFLIDAIGKVQNLPPEQQARAAELIMMLCEDFVGSDEPIKSGMTTQDFNELIEILTPFIIDVLADCPGKIDDVLKELGMDQRLIDGIGGLVTLLNNSPETLQALLGAITYKDGKIGFDTSKIPEILQAIIKDISADLSDWWNKAKANINKIGKDFMGAMFGKDILIDEEAFIKASDDLAALSERLKTLHGDVDTMLKTLEKGWDTPAGKKFKNSCDAILIQPLKDQKAVLDHVAAVLKTSKTQYQSVFEAYRNLNNTITSYAG